MKTNTKQQEAYKTLGFIVKGKTDANFIQFLVKDYFKNKFRAEIICMEGKASMASSAKIIISSFIQSGIDHVFMLFDTDNVDTDKQLKLLSEPIKKAGLLDNVTIIPVQPCIEMWLLSAFISNPEELKNMNLKDIKVKLLEFGSNNQKTLLSGKNLKKMIENNAEFKDFLKKLEEKIAA